MSKDIPSYVSVGAGSPPRSMSEIVENPPVFTEVSVVLSTDKAGPRAQSVTVEPPRPAVNAQE